MGLSGLRVVTGFAVWGVDLGQGRIDDDIRDG
jgi:hypothetical protein